MEVSHCICNDILLLSFLFFLDSTFEFIQLSLGV